MGETVVPVGAVLDSRRWSGESANLHTPGAAVVARRRAPSRSVVPSTVSW